MCQGGVDVLRVLAEWPCVRAEKRRSLTRIPRGWARMLDLDPGSSGSALIRVNEALFSTRTVPVNRWPNNAVLAAAHHRYPGGDPRIRPAVSAIRVSAKA